MMDSLSEQIKINSKDFNFADWKSYGAQLKNSIRVNSMAIISDTKTLKFVEQMMEAAKEREIKKEKKAAK